MLASSARKTAKQERSRSAGRVQVKRRWTWCSGISRLSLPSEPRRAQEQVPVGVESDLDRRMVRRSMIAFGGAPWLGLSDLYLRLPVGVFD